MPRPVTYIVAVLACLAFMGCGPAETPARAESISPVAAASSTRLAAETPVSTPAPPEVDAPKESSKRAPDALEQLKAQLNEIAAERVETAPASPPADDQTPPESKPDEVQQLRQDIEELHREVGRLQETVDAALAYLVGELGDENRRLKKDLATQEEFAQGEAAAVASVPEPQAPAAPPMPAVDYGEAGYLSIKEWGRTPEQAKTMGSDVSSLRGMICAVAPGSTDEELKAIGKKLRQDCAGYDNINIEIFDDEAAAKDYSERNVRSSAHFVMNITRHKASGRDVIVLVRDNGAREVVVE